MDNTILSTSDISHIVEYIKNKLNQEDDTFDIISEDFYDYNNITPDQLNAINKLKMKFGNDYVNQVNQIMHGYINHKGGFRKMKFKSKPKSISSKTKSPKSSSKTKSPKSSSKTKSPKSTSSKTKSPKSSSSKTKSPKSSSKTKSPKSTSSKIKSPKSSSKTKSPKPTSHQTGTFGSTASDVGIGLLTGIVGQNLMNNQMNQQYNNQSNDQQYNENENENENDENDENELLNLQEELNVQFKNLENQQIPQYEKQIKMNRLLKLQKKLNEYFGTLQNGGNSDNKYELDTIELLDKTLKICEHVNIIGGDPNDKPSEIFLPHQIVNEPNSETIGESNSETTVESTVDSTVESSDETVESSGETVESSGESSGETVESSGEFDIGLKSELETELENNISEDEYGKFNIIKSQSIPQDPDLRPNYVEKVKIIPDYPMKI